MTHWRRQFPAKHSYSTTRQLLTRTSLPITWLLWGDPGSNRVLARIQDRLPDPLDK